MKIHKPLAETKDQILIFIAEGFGILGYAFTHRQDQNISKTHVEWSQKVIDFFKNTFPTQKEVGQFLYTPGNALGYNDMDKVVENTVNSTERRLKVLERILDKLTYYYDFEPESKRLYIQSIDTFEQVRNLNASQVNRFLKNGFINISEKKIKEAFIEIIGQSYVPKDWGGETEDIYSSQLLLNGVRIQTSMILKGSGTVKGEETHQGDLGKNGDQLERMMRITSSKLYVVQSVKPVAVDIVNTMEAFIDKQRTGGNHCYYCIIDGQDTALILFAYGFLK